MKTKLLRKLRKLYELRVRNGKYKVFETRVCSGGIYNQTDWIDLKDALEIRRVLILKEAQKYITSKNLLR